VREPLGVALATWRAPLLVRDEPGATALLGTWAGDARAIVAPRPLVVLGTDDDPFAAVDRMPALAVRDGAPVPECVVGGGWFGRLGYPLGRRLEPTTGGPPPRPVPLPDAALAFHDHVVRQDADGAWWLEALWTPERDGALRERFTDLRSRARALEDARAVPRPVRSGPWSAVPSTAAHAAAVEACVARIAAGDLFQANLCQRFEAEIEGDLLELFAAAWRSLRPAKAAFTRGPWGAVASLSPELYLRRRGRTVLSSPIKGTRARGPDRVADEEARQELLRAEKDRAEHVMIVDLVRNDLGRVARPGSVRVPALAQPREAPGVWHLVSDVVAELRDEVRDGELLRATFPPGSVTGAPKVAAMQVIHELESTGRETYTGALGLVSPLAGLDLNVAIRTFEARDGRIWLGVGGGIVADSTGVDEAVEAADKAAPLLAAIGAPPVLGAGSTATEVLAPLRPGPRPLARPEPERGVFETLLVVDGVPQHLDAHLARLCASTIELYDEAPVLRPLIARIRDAASAPGLPARARLRVDAHPAGGGLDVEIACGPLPAGADDGAGDVTLVPVAVPGGLGAHKWSDRRLWDGLATAAGPDLLVLAVDLDGHVLETARSNVVAVLSDGTHVTPPLDGRILPGTTRARLLGALRADAVEVQERPLPLAELRRAREILLTGALRGVERAVLAGVSPGSSAAHR